MSKIQFSGLYFGLASAEAESAANADRFRRTYYDRWNLSASLHSQNHFLVVGPKGSGKSAVSEFIRLSLIHQSGEENVFARTLNLDEATPGISPLSMLTQKLVSEQATGLTDAAWRLFIALRFFDLLMQDKSCSITHESEARKLRAELARLGLLESDFPTVLRKVRENKVSVSLKGLLTGERSSKDSEEVPVVSLGEGLTRLILRAESANHFLLSIDGLDRIISKNPAYWLTLAALLRVGDDMHRRLLSARADIRLLVMCRSDVFRSIHFADADKIAGDAAIFIDWGAPQTVPADSRLWDYLAAKAEISPADFVQLAAGRRNGGCKDGSTSLYTSRRVFVASDSLNPA